MNGLFLWLGTAAIAFLASILSGVAGFGGAMIFLPVLVATHGVRSSVPILTVAVLLGNAARVYFFRRHLDWKIVTTFSLGSIPFAVLGSVIYVALPVFWIKKGIGAFLLSSVVLQRIHKDFRLARRSVFLPLGAVSGFLSALVGGIGPVSAPFFLAFGLAKEAFVGTEALCATGMHLAKSIAYNRLGVLNPKELAAGLSFGAVMIAGSYVAKKILERISRDTFLVLVEILLAAIGLYMLLQPS